MEPIDQQALRLWDLMGGTLDWNALPILVEIYDLHRIDALIDRLLMIRRTSQSRTEQGS